MQGRGSGSSSGGAAIPTVPPTAIGCLVGSQPSPSPAAVECLIGCTPARCRCRCGCLPTAIVVLGAPPRCHRRRGCMVGCCGRGCLPARPRGRVVPPRSSSSLWVIPHCRCHPLCPAPLSSSQWVHGGSLWPWVPPRSFTGPRVAPHSSSWSCGAPPLVVVMAVGALEAMGAPPVVFVAV